MKQSRKAILLALTSLTFAGTAMAEDNTRNSDMRSSGATAPGATASGATASGATASGATGGTGTVVQRNDERERNWERQHRASKIIGTEVHDMQGKKIGEVRDVVLDPSRGQIDYAVVSFGGVMGVGTKYFAVPWKSLQAASDANRYMLNVDKEALKNAPGFERGKWPDMASQQWKSDNDRFWQSRSGATSSGADDTNRNATGR